MTAQAGGASLSMTADRDRLRREMRAARRALSAEERRGAAERIAQHALRARLLQPGRRLACYLAHGGEVDLAALIASARQRRCLVYLPVITHYGAGRMRFVRYDEGAPLKPNRFGILEPVEKAYIDALRLDLVFAPVVAFDERGSRLGSGAGFYDRALQRLRPGRRWRRPRLIGVAYEIQRVEALDAAPWDAPLDAVLTETSLRRIFHENAGVLSDVGA